MTPRFLSLDEVIEIHADQIGRYGGSPGTRDLSLLESALAMPESGFGGQYLHADLYEMAAAYLYHLVQNHPFFDGNKRVGAASALVFLELNRVETKITDQDLIKTVLAVAQGKRGKAGVAEFFRKHARE